MNASIKDVEVKTSGSISLEGVNPSEARELKYSMRITVRMTYQRRDQKKAGRKL